METFLGFDNKLNSNITILEENSELYMKYFNKNIVQKIKLTNFAIKVIFVNKSTIVYQITIIDNTMNKEVHLIKINKNKSITLSLLNDIPNIIVSTGKFKFLLNYIKKITNEYINNKNTKSSYDCYDIGIAFLFKIHEYTEPAYINSDRITFFETKLAYPDCTKIGFYGNDNHDRTDTTKKYLYIHFDGFIKLISKDLKINTLDSTRYTIIYKSLKEIDVLGLFKDHKPTCQIVHRKYSHSYSMIRIDINIMNKLMEFISINFNKSDIDKFIKEFFRDYDYSLLNKIRR